ncbi:MAG: hypothetical protein NC340_03435 [Ruminococcus flavefaciens]|nr:hypothetical protein [Ruminococcus flavefaciens]MCM1229607.1 hypothetical protein [Ruminococcus flavefaciens]
MNIFRKIFRTRANRCFDVIEARSCKRNPTKFDRLMTALPLQYAMMSDDHTPEHARDCNVRTFINCLNNGQITEEEFDTLVDKNLTTYNKIAGNSN